MLAAPRYFFFYGSNHYVLVLNFCAIFACYVRFHIILSSVRVTEWPSIKIAGHPAYDMFSLLWSRIVNLVFQIVFWSRTFVLIAPFPNDGGHFYIARHL